MTLIQPNYVSEKRLLLGGAKLYIGAVITDKTTLPTMRNVGAIDKDNAVEFKKTHQTLEWRVGTPSKKIKETVISEDLTLTTSLSEIFYQPMSYALNATPTYTLGTYTDAVAATPAPTKTTFAVTSTTNLAANKLVEIDLSTGKEYRYIKSVNETTKVITLDEELSSAPASTDTVKDVTKVEMLIGGKSELDTYGLKLVKVMPFLNKRFTLIVFKASIAGEFSLSFQDDAKTSLPFSFTALSDPAVENGALAVLIEEENS